MTEQKKVDGVEFLKKDFLDTGFKENYFDVVWGLESICYAEDKRDFIQEAYRILKPGGRLIVADGFLVKEQLNQEENILIKKWLDGWIVPNLAGISQFNEYLEDNKFKNIKFSDIGNNVMPSSIRIYRCAAYGLGLWKFLRLIRIKSEMQVNHLIGGIYQHKTLKTGLWTYGIFYAEK